MKRKERRNLLDILNQSLFDRLEYVANSRKRKTPFLPHVNQKDEKKDLGSIDRIVELGHVGVEVEISLGEFGSLDCIG